MLLNSISVVLQESVHKSTHSTCSDGSLLSMASSEMDEVSSLPSHHHTNINTVHNS